MVALGGRGSVRLQAAGIARQRGEIRLRAMHKYTGAQRTNPLEKLSFGRVWARAIPVIGSGERAAPDTILIHTYKPPAIPRPN